LRNTGLEGKIFVKKGRTCFGDKSFIIEINTARNYPLPPNATTGPLRIRGVPVSQLLILPKSGGLPRLAHEFDQ